MISNISFKGTASCNKDIPLRYQRKFNNTYNNQPVSSLINKLPDEININFNVKETEGGDKEFVAIVKNNNTNKSVEINRKNVLYTNPFIFVYETVDKVKAQLGKIGALKDL